jgi:hypothetical protein
MRSNKMAARWLFPVSLALLLGPVLVSPLPLSGQSKGNNAVYTGSGTTATVSGSAAYIDASAFASTSVDICATLYSIMSATGYSSGVGSFIDARGLNSTNSNLSCAAGTSPWYNGTTGYINKPGRILLPAGKIVIAYPWVIPDYTKIVGVGSGSSGAAGVTTIQAGNGTGGQATFSGSAMIQMGGVVVFNSMNFGCPVCFEVSVSDLTLDGQGQTMDGIDNSNAEELSYVEHVAILNVEGNGLLLSTNSTSAQDGTASHSGPYLDLLVAAGSKATASTSCVKIFDAQPRGIHGLTCSASGSTVPKAAIYLDGGNVSIENVTISGFNDGVLIGSETPFNTTGLGDIYANILSNITGSSTGGTMANLIHICNTASVKGNCSSTGFSAEDVTLAGLTSSSSGINTIEDDLTTTSITDANVALYVLGEPVQGNATNIGYSRFSTSPSFPTWLVGTAVSPTGAACSADGSLYSRGNFGTAGSSTLWGCVSSKWALIK